MMLNQFADRVIQAFPCQHRLAIMSENKCLCGCPHKFQEPTEILLDRCTVCSFSDAITGAVPDQLLETLPDCIFRLDELAPRRYLCSHPDVSPTRDGLVGISECLNCSLPYDVEKDAADPSECDHRGIELREETCMLCGNRQQIVSIYRCEIFGECTIGKTNLKDGQDNEIASCVGCHRFEKK